MTSLDRGNHEDSYIGGFVNFIFNNFNINPSFRIDRNERHGLQFCPQLDINYNNKIINIRASTGKN